MGALERWQARRQLRRFAPLGLTSSEGSAVQATGAVRVLDDTVIAPLSGLECVIARSRVRAGSRFTDRTLFDPQELLQIKPFVVELADATPIVIDAGHVLFDVDPLVLPHSNIERESAFLARHALRQGAASFEEIVIRPGDRLTVGGVLMRDLNPQPPASERAFREGPPPTLRLVGSATHPLVIVALR